jgi:hypothetical protein
VTAIVKQGDWQRPSVRGPFWKTLRKRLPFVVGVVLAVLAAIALGTALALAVRLMLAALNWLIPPTW